MRCNFCNGEMKFIYYLDNYEIVQCLNCYTARVKNMPSDEEINNFYSGYKFKCNENIKDIFTQNYFRKWFNSFNLPNNARMLDIGGGGGGGFSYAFEYFNLGKAIYIDLDNEACEFARSVMGLRNVYNMNVEELDINEKFDFIYCRHVIEHLKDPERLIKAACNLISLNGIFVLHFPNGLSLERFGFKNIIKNKSERLKRSNNFSSIKSYMYLLSNKFCHGLDPINHLWSISKKGITSYLDNIGYRYEIKYALLDDRIYSPYFKYESKMEKIRAKLVNFSLTKIYGSAHLIVFIRPCN